MKRFFITFLSIFLLNFEAFSETNSNFETFLKILSKIESNNNPRAIGDNGRAIGIYQIHKNYFLDAQEVNKELKKYKYENCFDKEVSKKVVYSYIMRYEPKGDLEAWARLHNSGPNWRNKKELTNKYWERFKKIMLDSQK